MKAYVLINARAGTARDVVKKVQAIEGVQNANLCWGRPDIFAFVEGPSLADTVLDKIQTTEGVESTDTHIVLD